MLGDDCETSARLDELVVRIGADPASATVEQMTHAAARRRLVALAPGGEPQGVSPAHPSAPSYVFAKSEFFRRPLPPEAIAALGECFTERRPPSEARELDFTPWGGAYNRVRSEATAFAHRSERFVLKHAVALDGEASMRERDVARDWLKTSWSVVHPWGSGGVFPNFPDPDLADWATAYHGSNYERLTRVKARYDPDNLFRFHQSIPPARRDN
jgi:hypothetical protein